MPLQRTRNAFDDSRSEASSTRDRPPVYAGTAISKGRRNGTTILTGSSLKDVTNAQTTPVGHQGDAAVSVIMWRMASSDCDSTRSTGHLSILLCSMPIATCIASILHQPLSRHTIKGCLHGQALGSVLLQWHGAMHVDVLAKTFWR